LNFTDAKFDSSDNQDEKYITSSTGKYLVTWSLKNVVKGRIYDYEVNLLLKKIKPINDDIVGSDFKFNN